MDQRSQSSRRGGEPHPSRTGGRSGRDRIGLCVPRLGRRIVCHWPDHIRLRRSDLVSGISRRVVVRRIAMLNDKVFIITGAKGGLGTFVTKACLNAGATVAGVSRSISDDDFGHDRFRAIPAELTSSDAARSVVEKAVATFGGVDGVIHLVGAYTGGSSVADTDDAAVRRMLDVNLLSAFYMVRATLPQLRQASGGHIIAVGSRAAIEASPMSAAYAASKAALVSLIRATAAENADRN